MSNNTTRWLSGARCFGIAAALWMIQGAVLAQTPDLRPGNFELGLYGGASYGVDSFRPMGGINLSYSLPKLLLPYVEFSYFPELIRNYSNTSDNFVLAAKIEDFHAGVHIRILPHESRVVPYAVVGFGVLHSNTTGQDIFKLDTSRTSNISILATDPAVNFGAGLRVYHKSYLGYRIEFKEYRPLSGQFTKFFSKTEGGIFFQFGSH